MVVKLQSHEHGKGRVRLVKVTRNADQHTIVQLEAQILLEGAPASAAYYEGDNSSVLPTDTVKNTVYVLAKKHEFATLEDFAIILAKHFVQTHPSKIDVAKVRLFETNWTRIESKDSKGNVRPHHHAFVGAGDSTPFTYVVARKPKHGAEPVVAIQSGIDKLRVLKTTKSSFMNFFKDDYTTLPEVPDRLVATVVKASWNYSSEAPKVCFKTQAEEIKRILIDTFAGPADTGVEAPAVQKTLYEMGEAVLNQCPAVMDITITMPNVHNLPVDLTRFGLKNIHPHGEVFCPVDEPHGIIQATMVRATSKL